ncbi:MAG: hypothetical protein MK008_03035 [Bdellovibrionales bacterium]|nr:hypothetical protein [Bdellovibrionales bacterium]
MKQILIGLLFTVSTSVALATNSNNISCSCNVSVGDEYETINIPVELEEEMGYFEATNAEVAIVVSYKCLNEKNDVRRIHKVNSVTCDDTLIINYK